MGNFKATRMQLLQLKRKTKLASKGHKLLKEKNDALVIEFFSTLKGIKELRTGIGGKLSLAQSSLQRAEASRGINEIERLALGTAETEIGFCSKRVMGIEMPYISEIKSGHQWHGFVDSSLELDNAVMQLRELLPSVLSLSAKQLAFNRLAAEIKKTKRRVNSLEYIVIPNLENACSQIEFKLDERERENFTRLKMIKKKRSENENL